MSAQAKNEQKLHRSTAVRDTDEPVAADLIDAAVRTMADTGYHGTSVRDIATAAGVAVGSLYNYFGSKQELLVLMLNRGMDELLVRTEDALFQSTSAPADRLCSIVGVHVGLHVSGPFESMLGNTELRSLEPAALELVISKRDAQRRMFDRVILDGVERGHFATADPIEAARFIVSACTAVATWFRPGGPLTPEEVVARYQRIALDAVGYRSDTA